MGVSKKGRQGCVSIHPCISLTNKFHSSTHSFHLPHIHPSIIHLLIHHTYLTHFHPSIDMKGFYFVGCMPSIFPPSVLFLPINPPITFMYSTFHPLIMCIHPLITVIINISIPTSIINVSIYPSIYAFSFYPFNHLTMYAFTLFIIHPFMLFSVLIPINPPMAFFHSSIIHPQIT